MKGRVRGPKKKKRNRKRRKLFSCSWHRLAWLVGFKISPSPSSPSLLLSIFLSFSLSPPLAVTPLPPLPFLSSWIITFLAFRVMPAFSLFHFPRYSTPTPPVSPCLSHFFIIPLLPTHLFFCHAVVDEKRGAQSFFFLLSEVVWKYMHLPNIISDTVCADTGL